MHEHNVLAAVAQVCFSRSPLAHVTPTPQSLSNCLSLSPGALDDFDKTSAPPAPEPSAASSSASSGAEKVCLLFVYFLFYVCCF